MIIIDDSSTLKQTREPSTSSLSESDIWKEGIEDTDSTHVDSTSGYETYLIWGARRPYTLCPKGQCHRRPIAGQL